MPVSEFELIERIFAPLGVHRDDVVLGIGDDCALLQPSPGQLLAVSIDTLVAGVHFSPDDDPRSLGHKALAVNLSDLAASAAEPAWATLAMTLPGVDAGRLDWLSAFADGFAGLARRYDLALVGGDTTRGPLSITVQVHGFVPAEQALRRDGARAGEGIYLSGPVGDARLALLVKGGRKVDPVHAEAVAARLHRPEPRVELGRRLRGLASAAIDVSDGLVADLGHILERSGVGATIHLDELPLSAAVSAYLGETDDWALPLAGGDDYELCFTAPDARQAALRGLGCQQIGRLESEPGIRCLRPDGSPLNLSTAGYDHFGHD